MSNLEHELYVYTMESYKSQGLIKVGFCLRGRHRERIREQLGAGNPEPAEILYVAQMDSAFTDQHIHKQLQKNGIIRKSGGKGTEWFFATVYDVKKAFNQVIFGIDRIDNFTLRPEQQAAVNKAIKWYRREHPESIIDSATHKDRFLLNAKMRFGKCFTGIHIAKELEAKKVIIVTYKPEVIDEWLDTVNNHIDFNDWTGIRARKKSKLSIEHHLNNDGFFPDINGNIVLCVSLQDLNIILGQSTKERLIQVVNTAWDLIIFDEVHFGSQTSRAKYIIQQLKWRYRLDLSGTPFRLIQEDDFCPQQVFTYSYLDEQKNKNKEIELGITEADNYTYLQMPDLDISTIEITEQDIRQQLDMFVTDDLDFSLNELFKARTSGFYYEDAVSHFIDGLVRNDYEARSVSIYGKLGEKLEMPAMRHSVWWVKSINTANALARKLKNHPFFAKFEIINASGCENLNEDIDVIIARDKSQIEEKIKRCVNGNDKIGTITLTCKRFLTGVTIKEWESILILNDISKAESYYQAIFRVQSPWVNKKTNKVIKQKAWVFDFAITRTLRISYEYADALAEQLDQQDRYDGESYLNKDNLTTVISGLCDSLNMKCFYQGSLNSNKTTTRDIFNAMNLEGARVSLAKKITSDFLVNFDSLKLLEANPELFDVLKNIRGYRTQDVGSVNDFIQIGIEADKICAENKKVDLDESDIERQNREFVEKEKDKEKRTKRKWYATQIKRLAICMADFIYMTEFRESKIEHVIYTEQSDFFKSVTGISKEDFNRLCELGFIKKDSLNGIVREFRCQEDNSLRPEEYIFLNIQNLASFIQLH